MMEEIKISGLEDLSAALNDMQLDVAVKTLRSACAEAADEFLNELQNTAPIGHWDKIVKTKKGVKVKHTPGFLLSRIKKRTYTNKTGGLGGKFEKGDVVRVQTGAFKLPYIGFVEMGTSHQAANPFMRRAAAAKERAVLDRVINGLQTRIKRYERKMRK